MAEPAPPVSTRPREAARRQERAQRILDAAAALILRWGYNKTTIDDIARQAGVAKGTIYLHWKTREALFAALVKRENVEWLADFQQGVAGDPAGATLRGVLKHSALALAKRPLLKALLLRDADVIGKLAHSQHGSPATLEKVTGFNAFLEFLRARGLVRDDLSLRQQVYMLSAVFMGFFMVAPLLPEEMTLPDEDFAELLAETVHCALESGRTVAAAELDEITRALDQYLGRYVAVARAQYEQELE